MAELPADVTVKSEEAPPAAPASYDGPGPLNEPPETVAQAAPPFLGVHLTDRGRRSWPAPPA